MEDDLNGWWHKAGNEFKILHSSAYFQLGKPDIKKIISCRCTLEDASGVDSENEVEEENWDIEDADSSDMKESFEDDTKSSEDSNHPYNNRLIGKFNANGKEAQEYEKPEYLKKRLLPLQVHN